MNGYAKEDFFILLKYRNGAFSASLKRENGRMTEWSGCNSSQMLTVFEDIYQFMRSEKQETSIAGINVTKRKSSTGKDSFFMDFGLYTLSVMTPKDATKDTVIVRGNLPFNSSQQSNTVDYFEEDLV